MSTGPGLFSDIGKKAKVVVVVRNTFACKELMHSTLSRPLLRLTALLIDENIIRLKYLDRPMENVINDRPSDLDINSQSD
ncbi:hypothetical protein Tco_0574239 [Tanacetum coccineum]